VKLTTLKPRVKQLGARLQTVQPGSWRKPDQSSTARGYGYKWQQARAEYLRINPWCVYCLRARGIVEEDPVQQLAASVAKGSMPTAATVVDHRIPHRGDMKLFWRRSNWQSLCAPCHSGTKQREELDGSEFIRELSEAPRLA
jgi:5-methylcytosine-specific restriction endonuclease McrA